MKTRILILLTVILCAFAYIGTRITADNKSRLIDTQVDNKYEYFIEYFCAGNGLDIVKCQIILNDSASNLRTQSKDQSFYNAFSQVKLNKRTVDCFKSLLFELYSNNNTALKDGITNERRIIGSTQHDLSINLTLDDKKINEFFHVLDIMDSHENFDPFRPPFYKIMELIDAILLKADNDIYKNPCNYYRRAKIPVWITETFNDIYYETTYEINTQYEPFQR